MKLPEWQTACEGHDVLHVVTDMSLKGIWSSGYHLGAISSLSAMVPLYPSTENTWISSWLPSLSTASGTGHCVHEAGGKVKEGTRDWPPWLGRRGVAGVATCCVTCAGEHSHEGYPPHALQWCTCARLCTHACVASPAPS